MTHPPCTPLEPEINDDPLPELAIDLVPSADQTAPVATYKDWDPASTRIVTYAIGNSIYTGTYAETRDEARAHCELVHGRVLEANYVRGRAFFRVAKKDV